MPKPIIQKLNKKFILIIILAGTFTLPVITRAQFSLDPGGLNTAAIATGLYFVLAWTTNAMVAMADALNYLFSIGINGASGGSIETVKYGWGITRDFANMFFIIALIIMAFATIFDVSKYGFRELIGRFLITALFINFSLVIAEILIDWSQSLSNVFIESMGGSFSDFIGGNLNLTNLLGEPDPKTGLLRGGAGALRSFLAGMGGLAGTGGVFATFAVEQITFAALVGMVFSVILTGILAFAFLVAVVFTAIRIPIIWGLLMVAPAAWAASLFPWTINLNRMWWKYFLGWVWFLPIYLFYLYFAALFLSKQEQIIQQMNVGNAAISTLTQPIKGLGLSFQAVFFYLFVAFVMIYGAKSSMKSGFLAGAGGVAAGIWAKGQAYSRAATIGLAGKTIGLGWRTSGGEGVYKDAQERWKKEGFAGFRQTQDTFLGRLYRGERGREEAAARLGERTGLAPGLAERQLAKNIDSEKKKLVERRTGEAELRNVAAMARDPATRIAAIQRLQEEFNVAPTADQVQGIVQAFGGTQTEGAAKVLRQIKWGEMSLDDLRRFTDPAATNFVPTDRSTQSAVLNTLIERSKATREEIARAIELARGGAQRSTLIKKSKEYLTDYASQGDRLWLLNELQTNPALRTGSDPAAHNDTVKELLKIAAKKGDKFFHDIDPATGRPTNPNQTTLTNLANSIYDAGSPDTSGGSPAELRSFLEDIAKKYAANANTEFINRKIFKYDDGTDVTDVKEGMKRVFGKLNREEKLTQDTSQFLNPDFQSILAGDMSKSSSTLQDYMRDDKYAGARTKPGFNIIETMARRDIFVKQYLRPFKTALNKARNLMAAMELKTYPTRPAFNQDMRQANDEINDLEKIRKNYEDLYRYNGILSPGGRLDPETQTQVNAMDNRIQNLRTAITDLTSRKTTGIP